MKRFDKRKIIIYAAVLFGSVIVFVAGSGFIFSRISETADRLFQSPILSLKSAGCRSKAISYGIGRIDPEFNVSHDVFRAALKEAESIWESGSGNDLFIYSDSPSLKVNLVFDDRQAETDRLRSLLASIESDGEKLDVLKKEYAELSEKIAPIEADYLTAKSKYEALVSELNSTVALYNIRKQEYEDNVAYWNGRGGAPEKAYEQLKKEFDDVRILYEQISTRENAADDALEVLKGKVMDYNVEAGRINTVAGILNRLAEKLNESSADYNEYQGEREEFVTGTYASGNGERKIDVYQFYDYPELVTILAHEMGHALGIGHAADPSSIMYPKTTGQEAKISEEDLDLLKEVCAGNK